MLGCRPSSVDRAGAMAMERLNPSRSHNDSISASRAEDGWAGQADFRDDRRCCFGEAIFIQVVALRCCLSDSV